MLESEDLAAKNLLEASPGLDARKAHSAGAHGKSDPIRLYPDDAVSALKCSLGLCHAAANV